MILFQDAFNGKLNYVILKDVSQRPHQLLIFRRGGNILYELQLGTFLLIVGKHKCDLQ